MPHWPPLAAATLKLLSRRRSGHFFRALHNPADAQGRLLSNLVRASSRTQYGRTLGLEPDDGLEAFRAKVPLVTYDELAPWVDRQRSETAKAVLAEHVRCFERTSGSTGAVKYIPYNTALLRAFQSMFLIWAYDLLTHVMRPRTGRIFASVSPGMHAGLGDDTAYLSKPLQCLLQPFLVTPGRISNVLASADARDVLAACVVCEPRLEIVSVWSPTYLRVLLDHVARHRERLLPELIKGRINRGGRPFRFAPLSRERQALITGNCDIPWPALWPQLKLISCWDSASAAAPAAHLQQLFPDCCVQGKGLLATEAPITVPLVQAGGCVPLVDEVFLEFEDDAGNLYLSNELRSGDEYRLVISHKGGLLRYRLGDRIRVGQRLHATPCLEFVGREDQVSDLVGEKLNASFVENVLRDLLPDSSFRVLVPVRPHGRSEYYVLLCETGRDGLDTQLDQQLCKAFHYNHARLLGQLEAPHVVSATNMAALVLDYYAGRGMLWGDVKDRHLLIDPQEGADLVSVIRGSQPRIRADCTG
ncbi:MAG: GH3 family domain-containing protein [Gammaproteobacteria bacterium]